MNKILIEVNGLSFSPSQNGAYVLVLGAKNSDLKLPIIIGSADAQSIAMAVEGHDSKRPLTHDLFKTFADTFEIGVKEVVINRFDEGIFYAQIVCEKDGMTTKIDARASDSVALALRFGCPIFANQSVMDEAGVLINVNENVDEDVDEDENYNDDDWLETRSVGELKDLMEKAVDDEDYERASKIRDLIKLKEN